MAERDEQARQPDPVDPADSADSIPPADRADAVHPTDSMVPGDSVHPADDPAEAMDPADAMDPGDSGDVTERPESADGMPEMKPIPPEMYKGPGGCGFTGCMYAVMIFAGLALALLIVGLLTREWIVPVVPRG